MKLAATLILSLAAGTAAFSPVNTHSLSTQLRMSDEAAPAEATDTPAGPTGMEILEDIAQRSNPTINYWDPLSLAEANFWDEGNEATIGFLRHAEIKHARVAMAAFVGYCVQSNFHWPWAMTTSGMPFPETSIGPEAQWDAIPGAAKWQIFTVIAALELWDEANGGLDDGLHYMRGRTPGKYPSFQFFRENVHPVLDLYDPFGLFKKMSQEQKDKRLIMEINNGRLAMIGIFGFMAADAVPGSVPALSSLGLVPYEGNIMAPFSSDFSVFGGQ
jgi:hypothetical protein